MTKIKYLFALALTISSIQLSGQNTITGYVVDAKSKNTITDASVSLLKENKSIIKYIFTDKKGAFKITPYKGAKFLSITFLGYKPLIVSIDKVKPEFTYQLSPTDYKIKEVKVVWNRIKQDKDTLTYAVRGFRMKQDRSIADVIKKMPGLEVLPSGLIKFEDRAISKLYIEGMDLMGNRYAMATNNLSGKVVKEVQVLRNHQPIIALKGKSFSDQAAINLILEDEVKYNFNGGIDVGVGYSNDKDLLWSIRFLGMILGRRQQNLSLYKSNNTGNDVSDEISIKSFNKEFQPNSNRALINLPSLRIDKVDKDRYLDNRSHLFATNHLYKLDDYSTLRGQLSFIHQDYNMAKESQTSYFYPDNTIIIGENNQLSTQLNEWNLESTYEKNKQNCYIKDKLIAQIQDSKGNEHLVSNKLPIYSKQNIDSKEVHNFLKVIKSLNSKHVLKILSTLSYQELPQTLSVTPGLYSELLNDNKPYERFTQKVHLRSFLSQIATEGQFKIRGFYVHLKGGVNYQQQQLTSQLNCSMNGIAYPTPHKEFANDTKWEDSRLFITPSITYQDETWKLRFNIPLSYHNYQLKHRELPQKKDSYHRLFIEPQLHISADINGYWNVSTHANYLYQVPNINQIYAHYIFKNYRQASSGNGFYTNRILAARAGFKYTNPLYGFFWNANATLTPRWQDKILQSYTEGILTSQQLIDYKHRDFGWGLNTRLSKSFGWCKLVTALSARYNENKMKLLLSNEITRFTSKGVIVGLDIAIQPCKYISIEGDHDYFYSSLSNKATQNRHSKSMRNRINLNLFPTKYLKLKWNHLLINAYEPQSSSVYFMDAGISLVNKRLEFELSVNNILNRHSLIQTHYYSMSEQTTCNYFRPREVMAKIYLLF